MIRVIENSEPPSLAPLAVPPLRPGRQRARGGPLSDEARPLPLTRDWLLKRRIRRAAKRLRDGRISKTQYSAIALASVLELDGRVPRDSAGSLVGTEVDCLTFHFEMTEEPEFGDEYGPYGGAPMQLLKDSPQTGAQRVSGQMDSPVQIGRAHV